ncbi:MAG: HAD-IA family hydrolase [Alphaproteobacteria bacterium]|nr:HAD-IA family hydrolase [Alphaproteobacteria bacterium]
MATGPLKLCAFDLDGTLIDSQFHIVAAMTKAFKLEGLAVPPPAAVRKVIGLSLDDAIRTLSPEVSGLWIERVGNRYRDAYFDSKQNSGDIEPLAEGTLQMLDGLTQAGWQLAIVTGKGRRGLMSVLDSHGLRSRFVVLKSADDGPGKPDPTILLDAIEEAGAVSGTTVMIGDTVFDLQMARAARVASIGVTWGYHSRDMLLAERPAAMIERFAELPDVAERAVFGRMGG